MSFCATAPVSFALYMKASRCISLIFLPVRVSRIIFCPEMEMELHKKRPQITAAELHNLLHKLVIIHHLFGFRPRKQIPSVLTKGSNLSASVCKVLIMALSLTL